MAKYKILIKPSAVKELTKIPDKDIKRITDKIKTLADDPRQPGCEKLSGQDKYRLRQGKYRIIYSILEKTLIVSVIQIGHRKHIYK